MPRILPPSERTKSLMKTDHVEYPDETEEREMLVVKVDQGKGNRIWLHARDVETGDKHAIEVIGHRSYFFASGPKKQRFGQDASILNVEGGWESIETGQPLKKYEVSSPGKVKDLRSLFNDVHQADVPYTQVYLNSHEHFGYIRIPVPVEQPDSWKVHVDDIETLDGEPDLGLLHVVDLDIEVRVEEDSRMAKPHDPDQPIIMFGVLDRVNDQYILWVQRSDLVTGERNLDIGRVELKGGGYVEPEVREFGSEREMNLDFARWVRARNADVYTGWHSNKYDFPYILERFKRKGWSWKTFGKKGFCSPREGDPNIPGAHCVDLLEVHRSTSRSELKSNTLAAVVEDKFGWELFKGNVQEWYENDLEALVEYNLHDVQSTWAIDEDEAYTEFAMTYAYFVGVDRAADVHKVSIVHDVNMLKEANQRGLALPMRPYGKNKEEEFSGGKVMEPKPGIHEDVGVLDFSAQYPYIILSANISYETYIEPDHPEFDRLMDEGNITKVPIVDGDGNEVKTHHFRTDIQGIMPAITEELFEFRHKYEEKRSAAETDDEWEYWNLRRFVVKVAQNGLFGVNGDDKFRMYKRQVAESITSVGRQGVMTCADHATEELDVPGIYGDTDSVMLQFENVDHGYEVTDKLNERMREWARGMGFPDAERFELEFEKFFSYFLISSAKKKYAGTIVMKDGKEVDPPKVTISGFGAKRSDYPWLSGKIQRRILEMALLEGKDEHDIFQYVQEEYKKVCRGEYDAKAVFRTPGLRKKLSKYKENGQNYQAVKYSQDELGYYFEKDDRVCIVYVHRMPDEYEDPDRGYLALKENDPLPEGTIVNWGKAAELSVQNPVKRLFEAMGIEGSEEHLNKVKAEPVRTKDLDQVSVTQYM